MRLYPQSAERVMSKVRTRELRSGFCSRVSKKRVMDETLGVLMLGSRYIMKRAMSWRRCETWRQESRLFGRLEYSPRSLLDLYFDIGF